MSPTKLIRCIFTILAFVIFGLDLYGQTTFTSIADGNWSDPNTWDDGVNVPESTDQAIIDGHEVTFDSNSSGQVQSITIQSSGNLIVDNFLEVVSTLSTSGGGGTVTLANFLTADTYSFTGTSAITGFGVISAGNTFNVPSGTLSVGGISLTVPAASITGTISFTGTSGNKNFNGPINLIGGTINFAVAESTAGSGSRIVSSGTSTITGTAVGTMSLSSTLNVSDGTLTIGGVNFSVGGSTTVSGTLAFNSTSGTKSFENISVGSDGTWNNTVTESFSITGNITNSGTWNGCSDGTSCVYTLSSTSGIIQGTGAIEMPDIVINGTGSYSNIGELVVGDRLTGSGTFINAVGGSLEYRGDNSTGTNFDITTFTASATNNTVTYSGTTDQLLRQTSDVNNTYYNLVINTSAAGNDVTLDAASTVSNQLTLTTGDLILGSINLTMSDGALISGGNSNSYIQDSGTGVLRYEVSSTGTDLYVPIGGTAFSPITLNFSSASFGADPSVDFSITDSAHPNRDRDNTVDSPAGDDDGTAATDYLDVYWTIAGNDITSPVYSADYVYDASDFTQTTEANLVPSLYRELSGSSTLDWLALGVVNATTNTASLSRGDDFGDLYAMDNTLERLPVQLLSFTAKSSGHAVLLQWSTAVEENNSYFSVQRSNDGLNFKEMALVEGQGTTSDRHNYEFADIFPIKGRSYYRLKQVDFNGQFEYSEVISVVWNGIVEKAIDAYPTLLSQGEKLKVRVSDSQLQSYEWKIFDLSAKPFASGRNSGSSLSEIPTSALSSGVYFLKVILGNGEGFSRKFIVR